MSKTNKYNRQMAALGFTHARVWIPTGMEPVYQDRAAVDRIDHLHRIAEDAPDGDARLRILASMNRTKALTAKEKAALREAASNSSKVDAALADLDAIEAVMWDALRAANGTLDAEAAARHYARATVAALDYRRQRDLLQKGARDHGA
jgi:CHASE3 domain sensor protein